MEGTDERKGVISKEGDQRGGGNTEKKKNILS